MEGTESRPFTIGVNTQLVESGPIHGVMHLSAFYSHVTYCVLKEKLSLFFKTVVGALKVNSKVCFFSPESALFLSSIIKGLIKKNLADFCRENAVERKNSQTGWELTW